MRALFLIALLAVSTALANSRVANRGPGGPALLRAYPNSEHLLVSISAAEAVFSGSFTFVTAHAWRGDFRLFVGLYIWLPEDSAGDPAVEAFWKALGRNDLMTTNGVHLQALQRAVGLTVRVGDRELKPGKGLDSFFLKHYRPSVPLVPNPDQERVEATFRRRYPTYGKPEPEEMEEPGFCLVGVTFVESGTVITNQTLTVNYRQPLARCAEGGRFFYMPVFTGVPKDFSTTDTNRYSISFAARGCSLTITNGTQAATVSSGQSMTFGLQRHQPFRARATVGPSPQGGANGGQPSGSDTDGTSATAASRRSP